MLYVRSCSESPLELPTRCHLVSRAESRLLPRFHSPVRLRAARRAPSLPPEQSVQTDRALVSAQPIQQNLQSSCSGMSRGKTYRSAFFRRFLSPLVRPFIQVTACNHRILRYSVNGMLSAPEVLMQG